MGPHGTPARLSWSIHSTEQADIGQPAARRTNRPADGCHIRQRIGERSEYAKGQRIAQRQRHRRSPAAHNGRRVKSLRNRRGRRSRHRQIGCIARRSDAASR